MPQTPITIIQLQACADGQVQIEHYHRYLFARSLVAGLDVLDVASGEGEQSGGNKLHQPHHTEIECTSSQRVDLPVARGQGDDVPRRRDHPPGVQPAEVPALPQRRDIDDDLTDAHAAPLLLPARAGVELLRTTQDQSLER